MGTGPVGSIQYSRRWSIGTARVDWFMPSGLLNLCSGLPFVELATDKGLPPESGQLGDAQLPGLTPTL